MMKHIINKRKRSSNSSFCLSLKRSIVTALILASCYTSNCLAISDDECAIWLCAPVGFGPGECGPAHRAMVKRVHLGKGPIPPFSLCNLNLDIGSY